MLDSFVRLECRYAVRRAALAAEGVPLRDQLRALVAAEAEALRGAALAVGGALPAPEAELLGTLPAADGEWGGRAAGAFMGHDPRPRTPALTRAPRRRPAGGRRGEKPKRVAVGLWVPALGGAGTDDEGPRAVPGRLELRGAVWATAAAYVREPVARARLDLAEDVLRSLRARVETTLEDLAEAGGDADAGGAAAPADAGAGDPLGGGGLRGPGVRLRFPRRATFAWQGTGGRLSVSDYLAAGEGEADARGRLGELLGAAVAAGAAAEAVEAEAEAFAAGPVAPWDPAAETGPAVGKGTGKGGTAAAEKTAACTLAGAGAAALAAGMAALWAYASAAGAAGGEL